MNKSANKENKIHTTSLDEPCPKCENTVTELCGNVAYCWYCRERTESNYNPVEVPDVKSIDSNFEIHIEKPDQKRVDQSKE